MENIIFMSEMLIMLKFTMISINTACWVYMISVLVRLMYDLFKGINLENEKEENL